MARARARGESGLLSLPRPLGVCSLLILGKSLEVTDDPLLCPLPGVVHTLLGDITPGPRKVPDALKMPRSPQQCIGVFLDCTHSRAEGAGLERRY